MAASGLAPLREVLVPPRCAGWGSPGSWFCAGCRDGSDPIVRRIGAPIAVRIVADLAQGVRICGARGVRAYVVAFEE